MFFVFFLQNKFLKHVIDITEANASPASKFLVDEEKFVTVKWCDLAVGDIVQISSRETIPADLLILGVAEKIGLPPQGICYVETKSLDGEVIFFWFTYVISTI